MAIERKNFSLFGESDRPLREPQIGALGALIGHWASTPDIPAVIALPTGVGKTAVAQGALYLAAVTRTLLVVPNTELREQSELVFRELGDLRAAGCIIPNSALLTVAIIKSRKPKWAELELADVVVGHPASISPALAEGGPPQDFFDLIIVDEAHHTPAKSWMAILEHFKKAKVLLLTATPIRKDRQRLPGNLIFSFPLKRALEEGVYKPIKPVLLEMPPGPPDQTAVDRQIAEAAVELLQSPEHDSSCLLIRVANKSRARALKTIYLELGIDVELLHSDLSRADRLDTVKRLREGSLKAVIAISMITEGFNLPSLRILAYHDKYKSIPATAQLIGRLARVDSRYDQDSILITVRDEDVFPGLQGALRALYQEDDNWHILLPSILDEQISEKVEDEKFVRDFGEDKTATIDLLNVNPPRKVEVFEIPYEEWPEEFWDTAMLTGLSPGALWEGRRIVLKRFSIEKNLLVIVTSLFLSPRWSTQKDLTERTYQLLCLSVRPSSTVTEPHLVFLTSDGGAISRTLLDRIREKGVRLRAGDPAKMQTAFDGIERVAVSSLGVRNNSVGGAGLPSYKMFSGSRIETGMKDSDVEHTSLGHAMVQAVGSDRKAYTAGLSTKKAKYWETRYSSLRAFDTFIDWVAESYWFPPQSVSGTLFPQVQRGHRLSTWPDADLVAIEADYSFYRDGRVVADESGNTAMLAQLDIAFSNQSPQTLHLRIAFAGSPLTWRGTVDVQGQFAPLGNDLVVRRGYARQQETLSSLMTRTPPTFYFSDGTTVRGHLHYPRNTKGPYDPKELRALSWTGTDIEAETERQATKRKKGRSIHARVVEHIQAVTITARRRWIIFNDGALEMADHLVLELYPGNRLVVELWHSKGAGNSRPSVRLRDLQEVTAQAIKSRRWLYDTSFLEELGRRLLGLSTPKATVLSGPVDLLLALCGQKKNRHAMSWTKRVPIIHGKVRIVQPGLSKALLLERLAANDVEAHKALELLSVAADSTVALGERGTIYCSG